PDRAVLRRGLEPGPVLLRAAAVPARPGGRAPGPAAAAAGDPGVWGRRMGGHRLVLADGRGPGQQGHPQPGGQLGPAVGAPVAHLARDAPPVPPRAYVTLRSALREVSESGALPDRTGRAPLSLKPGWGWRYGWGERELAEFLGDDLGAEVEALVADGGGGVAAGLRRAQHQAGRLIAALAAEAALRSGLIFRSGG